MRCNPLAHRANKQKRQTTGLPFNLYIATLFNLHEWIALACYEAIEVSYAALIWFLFLAMGDIEKDFHDLHSTQILLILQLLCGRFVGIHNCAIIIKYQYNF